MKITKMQIDLDEIREFATRLPSEKEIAAAKTVSLADKTRLSYWFPKLEAVGLPVPKTILVHTTDDELTNAYECALDDVEPKEMLSLAKRIKEAADQIGYPCFLRTDYTSGKHNWKNTCFLQKPEDVLFHVMNIIEYSECVSFVGLPCDVWAVRELLPATRYGVCTAYGDMPITYEFRVFVDGYKVKCMHPYWPVEALEEGKPVWDKEFHEENDRRFLDGKMNRDDTHEFIRLMEIKCGANKLVGSTCYPLAACAGCAVGGGEWSVDILETKNGLYIIDMAEACKSYHWKGCKNVFDPPTA